MRCSPGDPSFGGASGGRTDRGSDCGVTPIPVPYSDRFAHIVNKDLSVSNPSAARGARDRVENLVEAAVDDHKLELHFRQQIDVIFLSAVNLFVALLASVSPNLADGHSIDPYVLQGFFDFLELERLDDRFDFFHKPLFVSGLQEVTFFAMLSQIQPLLLYVMRCAHSQREIADFENHERSNGRQPDGDQNADRLVQ